MTLKAHKKHLYSRECSQANFNCVTSIIRARAAVIAHLLKSFNFKTERSGQHFLQTNVKLDNVNIEAFDVMIKNLKCIAAASVFTL